MNYGHAGEITKLYQTRGLNPRVRPKRRSMGGELPLLPFGYPIGYEPTSRGGVFIALIMYFIELLSTEKEFRQGTLAQQMRPLGAFC